MKQFRSQKAKTDFYFLKVNIIQIGFFTLALVIMWRLYNVQILRGSYYRDASLNQISLGGAKLERGLIYFENKNHELIPAAVNKSGYTLAINPNLIKNPEDVFRNLSQIVSIDREDFFVKAAKKGDPFEVLLNRVDKSVAQKIRIIIKDNSGIILVPEEWRFYPVKNLAAHVLGFVGYEGNELKGRYGVESYYNEYLSGKEKFTGGSVFHSLLDFGERVFSNYEIGGSSVVLTIEPMLQGVLEANLEKVLSEYNGRLAAGVIINPQDGRILALAAKPDFDLNDYRNTKDISVFNNPITQNIYEVGSIFKPLTLAAAFNENVISPDTKYYDEGYVVLSGRRIENYDGKGRGEIDMQQVLNQSLNTGAVFAMRSLGKSKFKNYVIKYGLNSKTGVDLPGEVAGKIDNLNSNRDIEFATASFGQGVAVTPIEFASAAASLSNGGKVVKPYVVDRIILSNDGQDLNNEEDENGDGKDNQNEGTVLKTEPRVIGESIKKETSEKISAMLTRVVDDALLGGTVKMEHYSIAAKTGTAQRIKVAEKGYSDDYLHTFLGYAPSFDPKFLVVLLLERPQGVKYASHSLTPAFMEIMKFIINYYEVPPDR